MASVLVLAVALYAYRTTRQHFAVGCPRLPLAIMAKVTTPALDEIGDLIESGAITPVIDRTCPLTDAATAVRLVEEGSPAGKVIVLVDPPPPEPPPR